MEALATVLTIVVILLLMPVVIAMISEVSKWIRRGSK